MKMELITDNVIHIKLIFISTFSIGIFQDYIPILGGPDVDVLSAMSMSS